MHAGWKNSNEVYLSLLGCAYSDIKSSLLQHLKDIAEGNYDGGRGPSQPVRQKRKLSKEIRTATQIGKDLLDFDVDMSIAPTMVNSDIFKTGGGCEPQKRKKHHIRSCLQTN